MSARYAPRTQASGCAGGPRQRGLDDLVERDLCGRLGAERLAFEIDELVDEAAQLGGLGHEVGEDRPPFLLGDVGGTGEQLEVGAEARERRPQLV